MMGQGVGQCEVTLKGNLAKQDLFAQLSKYDVLLHPTLGENFGHSIVEAMALGVPVLISDKSPWTDVAESSAGWALPLSQPAAFAEKLQTIFAMGEAWSIMSAGAVRYVKTTLNSSPTVERYRDVYG
mgnify:CR=1 FL=1